MSTRDAIQLLRWPLALVWTGLTLYLMLSPTVRIPYNVFGDLTDKVGHCFLFGVLAVSWYGVLVGYVPRRAVLIALVATITLGGCTELAQSFVPGRDANFFDFLSNALGVSTAAALVSWRGTVAPALHSEGGPG